MQKVENGLFISVDYTGSLDNGEQFDSSAGRRPMEFKMGAGQVIEGFEQAVANMALDEEKTFTLQPEKAYGEHNPSLTREFARADLPPEMDPQVGQSVGLTNTKGRQIPAQITEVNDQTITLDLNHPLAGQALTFKIKVVGISDTPQQPQGCSGCDCESEDSCSGCD
jgi:peptidylprolyl isomerase